jgi:HEAT repeat protein
MKTGNKNRFLSRSLQSFSPRLVGASWFRRALLRFEQWGVRSNRSLVVIYGRLSRYEKFLAIAIFRHNRYRRAIPLLFRELDSADSLIGGASSAALAMIGGDKVLARLSRSLCSTQHESHRLRVLSALGSLAGVSGNDGVATVLENVAADPDEPEQARAIAAEGLVNALQGADRRRCVWRSGEAILLAMLHNECARLRCSAVFASGQLRLKRAVPALRRMLRLDNGVCAGRASIADTVREALESITGNSSLFASRKKRTKR